MGLTLITAIFLIVQQLNMSLQDLHSSNILKYSATSGIGILTSLLNLLAIKLYEWVVDKMLSLENHRYFNSLKHDQSRYESSLRRSRIIKKYSFRALCSVSTLAIQAFMNSKQEFLFEFRIQALSIMLSSMILFFGIVTIKCSLLVLTLCKSLWGPFFHFISSRYYIYSYLLTCKCCCGAEKTGRIEAFKKAETKKFLSDPQTSFAFTRY